MAAQPTSVGDQNHPTWAGTWTFWVRLLDWYAKTFSREGKISEGINSAFQFLQACEFSFPRVLSSVEAIVNYHEGFNKASYTFYCGGLENWFRPVWMKQLDEMGIPLPLSERLSRTEGSITSKDQAINLLRSQSYLGLGKIDRVDNFLIQSAIEAL